MKDRIGICEVIDMRELDKYTARQEIKSKLKEGEMKLVEIEVMLHINNRLFKQGLITEEMYRLAKEEFLHA